MATGTHSSPQFSCAGVSENSERKTKSARTGSEQRNSMPLLRTMRLTQMERGIAVERTSLASLLKARVKSETEELNHTHGSSAVMRNTMYGSCPTVRLNTCVNT